MKPVYMKTLLPLCALALVAAFFYFSVETAARSAPQTTATSSSTSLSASSTRSVANISSAATTLSKIVSSQTAKTDPSTNTLLKNMKLTFDDEFNSFSYYADAHGNVTCSSGGTGTWQTVFNFCSRTEAANGEHEVYIDQA